MTRGGPTPTPRAWSDAHEAWREGGDPIEAGSALPGELPLALRALAALERNDEAGTRALLAEAEDEGALAAVAALRIALTGGEEGSGPPRVRIGSPVLDGLAGSIDKWLRGGSPRGSKALLAAARHRPVAESVRRLLAKRGSNVISLPIGLQEWPRARALVLSLWGARLSGQRGAAGVLGRSAVADFLDLDRYPGLDQAISAAQPRALRDWLHGGPWSSQVQWALERVIDRPPPDGDALLARVVDRLRAEIEAGRPATALEALPQIVELACRLDHHEMEEDIRRLEGKLGWASSGRVFPGLLVSVWRAARDGGEGPRALVEIARHVVEAMPEEATPSDVREAVTCLLRWGSEPGLRTDAVMAAPGLISAKQLRDALSARDDLGSAEVAWLVGLHGAKTGDAAAVIAQGTALLEAKVRPDRACDLLLSVWPGVSKRGANRKLVAAARRSVDALAALGRVDLESAHRLARSLGLLRRGLGRQRAVVRSVALASIPDDLSPADPEVGHALALHARLDGVAAAREILRDVGRVLRSLPTAEADTLAFGILARVRQWEPVPLQGDLARVAQPLEAWLEQAGEERLFAAAQALSAHPAAANVSAALWLQDRELSFEGARRLRSLTLQLSRGASGTVEGLRAELLDRLVEEELLPF